MARAIERCPSRREPMILKLTRAPADSARTAMIRRAQRGTAPRACRGRPRAATARDIFGGMAADPAPRSRSLPEVDGSPYAAIHCVYIASTHSHGKHEIHITRSLSLHLDEQGLCDVRGCAKQLGVFTMLWSSAGADVQHLVIACCRLVLRSAGEAARELFGRRPSYWSRSRPPAGRSRRERTPI